MAVVRTLGTLAAASAVSVGVTTVGPAVDVTPPVWTSTALTAAQVANAAADLPLLVADNVMGELGAEGAPQWRNGGSWATGTDETLTDTVIVWRTLRTYDGLADVPSAGAFDDPQHLLCHLDMVAFDTIAILGHNFADIDGTSTLVVRVEIADDEAFTTRLQAIAEWSIDFGRRLVETQLGAGLEVGNTDGARYSDVTYLRVVIEGATGIPEIGEVYLGTRYSPDHRQDVSTDEQRLASRYEETVADDGTRQRVPRWTGRLQTSLLWMPDDDSYVDLFRDFFAGTSWGHAPALYIPEPATDERVCYFVRVTGDVSVANVEGDTHTVEVALDELAPYVSKEQD